MESAPVTGTAQTDQESTGVPPFPPPPSAASLADAVIETASVALFIVSAAGTIERANRAAGRLLGRSAGELAGMDLVGVTHPDDREDTTRAMRLLAAGRIPAADLEKRYLRPDGTPVWAHVTAVAARSPDGMATHFLSTARDLSDVRDLAARLDEATIRYRRLVDANVLGVAVATETGVVEANDEMLRLAGVSRDAFERAGLDWVAITPPEQLSADRHALEEMIERGACTPFEKEYVHADGTRVPILVGAALVRRDPLTWIAFLLDLTERKRAEAERDRLLEEARAARVVAEGALQDRDRLLATVVHDLRTPLGANYGYAKLMHEGIPEPLPAVHRATLERMMANQTHVLALIERLLDFARGTSGAARFSLQELDVDDLLGGVEASIAPQLATAGLRFESPPCHPPLTVHADRQAVAQILINLLGNAIKFTPSGGTVRLCAEHVGERVAIRVADTGVGIPAEQLDQIFQPFVQLGANAQRELVPPAPAGFGLGLAISRELARGMGGDLTVVSAPGNGSTFTVTLRVV